MKYELKIENQCGEDWRRMRLVNSRTLFRLVFSKIIVSLLFICFSETTAAQVKKYETHKDTDVASSKDNASRPLAKKKTGSSSKKIIKGQIRDSVSMKAIPLATVFLKGGNMHVQADSNGYFQMTIPTRLMKEKLTLVIGAEWYFNKEFIINRQELNTKKEYAIVKRETITVEATATSRKKKNAGKWWQLKKKV